MDLGIFFHFFYEVISSCSVIRAGISLLDTSDQMFWKPSGLIPILWKNTDIPWTHINTGSCLFHNPLQGSLHHSLAKVVLLPSCQNLSAANCSWTFMFKKIRIKSAYLKALCGILGCNSLVVIFWSCVFKKPWSHFTIPCQRIIINTLLMVFYHSNQKDNTQVNTIEWFVAIKKQRVDFRGMWKTLETWTRVL